jgi:hypothetical protein
VSLKDFTRDLFLHLSYCEEGSEPHLSLYALRLPESVCTVGAFPWSVCGGRNQRIYGRKLSNPQEMAPERDSLRYLCPSIKFQSFLKEQITAHCQLGGSLTRVVSVPLTKRNRL